MSNTCSTKSSSFGNCRVAPPLPRRQVILCSELNSSAKMKANLHCAASYSVSAAHFCHSSHCCRQVLGLATSRASKISNFAAWLDAMSQVLATPIALAPSPVPFFERVPAMALRRTAACPPGRRNAGNAVYVRRDQSLNSIVHLRLGSNVCQRWSEQRVCMPDLRACTPFPKSLVYSCSPDAGVNRPTCARMPAQFSQNSHTIQEAGCAPVNWSIYSLSYQIHQHVERRWRR